MTVTTDDGGEFRFSNIPVGTYTLTGEASGFAKTTQTGIRVQLTQATVVNLDFRPGNIGETVQVTTGGTAQTTASTPRLIGTVIDDVSQKPVPNATVIVSRRTCDCRRECQENQPCDSCCPYVRENSTSTNEKGEFTIDVVPGDYNFRIATGAITKDQQRKVTSKATQRIKIHVDLPTGGAKQ